MKIKKLILNNTMMIQVKLFLENPSNSSKLTLEVKDKMRKIMKTIQKIHNRLVIRGIRNILNNKLLKIPDNSNHNPIKNRNLNHSNNNCNQHKNNRKRNKGHLS